MSIGLDLGGQMFRSLRQQENCLRARASQAAYAIILDNPARRSLFAERQVPFAEFGMNLILFGDSAVEWSNRLSVSAIPLSGQFGLRLDDRVIRQVITSLIEGLVPNPDLEPDDCCLTMPHGNPAAVQQMEAFLTEVIQNLGYRPWFTSSSLSVALSELAHTGMTGLGIYLGIAHTEISIVRQGVELACFEIPRGTGRHRTSVANMGSELTLKDSLTQDAEMLREIFGMAAFELQRRPERKALTSPVTIAISGDIVAEQGMADLIPASIQHASWPFAIRTLQLASDPAWAVCRGCLIQAELEQLTTPIRQVA